MINLIKTRLPLICVGLAGAKLERKAQMHAPLDADRRGATADDGEVMTRINKMAEWRAKYVWSTNSNTQCDVNAYDRYTNAGSVFSEEIIPRRPHQLFRVKCCFLCVHVQREPRICIVRSNHTTTMMGHLSMRLHALLRSHMVLHPHIQYLGVSGYD